MKNTAVLYAAIALGVIALALGVYYLTTGAHPFRAFVGLGVGALLLIGGVVGMFMGRPKAVSR
jgi:hypothetical protein